MPLFLQPDCTKCGLPVPLHDLYTLEDGPYHFACLPEKIRLEIETNQKEGG